uniref:Uncharacterized protein n=1 Tax=Panagrolaimus davidi TaxID=227884 RepID=A0A914P0Y2_9BILA
MLRISKESHTLKKKKYQPNYMSDGLIFQQKSLLNKRGSECFSVGTCLVRLQDFSNNFNTFNNTVWTVVNHNLIRKYEHVSKNGDYEYFKPTDRYTRWLPHFTNDYICIIDVKEINDSEFQIAIRFPSRERIATALEASTRNRHAHGLPPIASYNPLHVEREGAQSIVSKNENFQTTIPSSSTYDSFDVESLETPTNFDSTVANVATGTSSTGIYGNYGPSNAFYYNYSDLQQMFMNGVYNGENSVDTNVICNNNSDPSNAYYYPQQMYDQFYGNGTVATNGIYNPVLSDAFYNNYSYPQQISMDDVFYGNDENVNETYENYLPSIAEETKEDENSVATNENTDNSETSQDTTGTYSSEDNSVVTNEIYANGENSVDTFFNFYDNPEPSDAFFYNYSDPPQSFMDEIFFDNGENY